ncbi:DUF805 domain-containing protein [Lactovum miscens]|uniref:Uncharacterized membrane protein YhaH (DUF805 family) n=1 Tax=Lactovum miscens TaxID=190387 RepID=A0A841C8G4_9LACT|nr:DUF805 domain-containing protein [Lactovum miscens]MBB5888597.1 uncharacterized membrane protein YhaH (DUF805 family) [Lactovum miscens]
MVEINQVSGKVGFGQAIRDFIVGYFNLSGRTTRTGFWFVAIFLSIIMIPIYLLYSLVEVILASGFIISDNDLFNPFYYFLIICSLTFIIPTITTVLRRMNDIGFSFGWRSFILFIILVLIILAIYNFRNNIIWINFTLFMGQYFIYLSVLIFGFMPSHCLLIE